MKFLLLLTVFASVLACKRSDTTTEAKMAPSLTRTWWFDVALDEEKFDPNHDEERSPAPARQKGEQVKIAVYIALAPKERRGVMKIKYLDDPTDCQWLELRRASIYDNGDMEVSFRAQGTQDRELRGIFSEESDDALDTPYHEQFFFHLKIMQPHPDGLASLFSMNDADSFTLKPEEVRKKYFDDEEEDSQHCKKVKHATKK